MPLEQGTQEWLRWREGPSALERNLNLVLQVLEITDRVVVAVNLMDEARRKGIDVDTRTLARDLGVPVIPIVARTGEGMHALLTAVSGVASGAIATTPLRVTGTPEFEHAVFASSFGASKR